MCVRVSERESVCVRARVSVQVGMCVPLLVPSSPAIMRRAREAWRTHAGDMLHAAMCPGDMRFEKLTDILRGSKKKNERSHY